MSDILTLRQQLESSLELTEIESRLRALIAQRDRIADHLRDIDEQLAAESRRYANAQGLTVRPTREQLRLQLVQKARPRDGR